MSSKRTPERGRRFRLCETHRVSVVGEGEPCEICELQKHKTDLLAACRNVAASLVICQMPQLDDGVATNDEIIALALGLLEFVIAAAEGGDHAD